VESLWFDAPLVFEVDLYAASSARLLLSGRAHDATPVTTQVSVLTAREYTDRPVWSSVRTEDSKYDIKHKKKVVHRRGRLSRSMRLCCCNMLHCFTVNFISSKLYFQ
jgi:hypothetical protein